MTKLSPVAELMEESRFWQIIDQTLAAAEAKSDNHEEQQEPQVAALEAALKELEWQDIAAFQNRFNQLMQHSYRQDLWCAAYLMCGGCSDDGFDYFRSWLLSRGEAVFKAALSQPDSLAKVPVVTEDSDYYEFEDFAYVANDVFRAQTGEDLYQYASDSFAYPPIEFEWEEGDESSMQRLCPKLYTLFWD